jgi:hypothetical protein
MTGLTDGNQITHYISSGIVSDEFAQPLPCTTWAQDEEGAWVQTSHWPGMPQAIAQMAATRPAIPADRSADRGCVCGERHIRAGTVCGDGKDGA